jgi:hypothetical protein
MAACGRCSGEPVDVTLPPEVVAAVKAEAKAVVAHGKRAKTEKYRADPATRLARNEDGFGAEEAAALVFGTKRTQRGVVKKGFARDLENGLEVRQTDRPDGSLILHNADPSGIYVLVTGSLPSYRVVGWIGTEEGRILRWWRSEGVRYPAYFIPQSALHRMPLHEPGAAVPEYAQEALW